MKTIPAAVLSHLAEDATTLCRLLRIRTKSGTVIGFTNLDVDIIFDDGDGDVTYWSSYGFVPSRFQASADMAVDNAEFEGVLNDLGITEQQIAAGLFDMARFHVYEINYMDPVAGEFHWVSSGRLGATRFSQGMWITESRSLTQLLKQTLSRLYSLTCRARFGSFPLGTGGGVFEERFPCGKAFTWVGGTVTSVGANPRRVFTDTALTQADNYFMDGVVEWLTGNNAGAQMEVDSHASDTLTLALQMPYAIQVGDTFRVRKDCSKQWDDADNGCLFHWGADRKDHFRGEPHIPVADGGANMVPGAQVTRR